MFSLPSQVGMIEIDHTGSRSRSSVWPSRDRAHTKVETIEHHIERGGRGRQTGRRTVAGPFPSLRRRQNLKLAGPSIMDDFSAGLPGGSWTGSACLREPSAGRAGSYAEHVNVRECRHREKRVNADERDQGSDSRTPAGTGEIASAVRRDSIGMTQGCTGPSRQDTSHQAWQRRPTVT